MRNIRKFPLVAFLTLSFLIFSIGATTSQLPIDENTQILSIYNYDTGEILGTVQAYPYDPSLYEIPSPENVNSGELGDFPPPHGFGGEGWTILLGTTSFVNKIEVDFDDRQIHVHVSGDQTVPGFFQLWVSGERLVSEVRKVEVALDNFPLENVVTIDYGPTIIVYVWYTHSTRILVFSLGEAIAEPGFPSLTVFGVIAIPLVAGGTYWFRFRRR